MDIKVKFTIPKELLSQSIVQDSIAQMMTKKTAPEVVKLFDKTVEGWDNKPIFDKKLIKQTNYISQRVWADGNNKNPRGLAAWKQYALVSRGTSPHSIPKTGLTYMRFQDGRGYKASTTPRILKSGPRSNTGAWITKFSVNHPGFEAREFDQTIADEYRPTFTKDMRDAISVAAAKTAQSNK